MLNNFQSINAGCSRIRIELYLLMNFFFFLSLSIYNY